MAKGEIRKNSWVLLRRTKWRPALHFVLILLMFFLVSRAHFLAVGEWLTCLLCTLGFQFLCEFYRDHVGPVMLRILKPDLLVPFSLGFGLALGYVGKRVGQDLGLPNTVMGTVLLQAMIFMLMASPPAGMAWLLIIRSVARQEQPKS